MTRLRPVTFAAGLTFLVALGLGPAPAGAQTAPCPTCVELNGRPQTGTPGPNGFAREFAFQCPVDMQNAGTVTNRWQVGGPAGTYTAGFGTATSTIDHDGTGVSVGYIAATLPVQGAHLPRWIRGPATATDLGPFLIGPVEGPPFECGGDCPPITSSTTPPTTSPSSPPGSTVPLPPGTPPATTPPPSVTAPPAVTSGPAPTLPATGASSGDIAYAGFVVLAVGAFLLLVLDRRPNGGTR